jgi:chromosome segregation ATPase
MLDTHQSHLEQTKKELSLRSLDLVKAKAAFGQLEERMNEVRSFQESCNFEWNQAHHEAQEIQKKESRFQDELKGSQKTADKLEKEIAHL